MNLDALEHFAQHFLPLLRKRFGPTFPVDIVGADPLPEVRALCSAQGWHLYANASEAELQDALARASATILPFSYATGAKLKLLTSLASGVPVLGTSAVNAQADLVSAPSLLSDAPARWADRLEEIATRGISSQTRAHLRTLAEAHSWDRSARLLLDFLPIP